MKFLLHAAIFYLGSGVILSRADPDVDCQGEYGPWSVCEPLEGHATHHDSDDDFMLDRGPNGEFIRDCFHFQTYKIVVPKSGNGRECSRKEGSKRFRYCEDCSRIPSVHKRLEAQQATDSLHTFTIIAGIFCLFTMAALTALCVRKVLKDTASRPEQVTLYSSGSSNATTQQRYQTDVRRPNTAPTLAMTPEYTHHSAKHVTADSDCKTEAGDSEYGA